MQEGLPIFTKNYEGSFSVNCPYCNLKQAAYWDERPSLLKLIHCDEELGGCGFPFVITLYVYVKPTVAKLTWQEGE